MLVKSPQDLQGEAPGGRLFEDHLFLLNERGEVIASRSELKNPVPGEAFFDVFPAKDSEKNELFRFLTGFGDAPVFLRCSGKTVLFLTLFFAETGLIAALVPRHSLAVYTDAPAALTDSFPGVYFTEEVRKRSLPPNEQQYIVIRRYLSYCGRTEIPSMEDDMTRAFYNALSAQIDTVARQTGCTIIYNFSELDIRMTQNPALGRFAGILYLMALVAIRAAKNRTLTLSAEPIDPETPLFVAGLELADPDDPLPELNEFGFLADSFGFYADYYREGERYALRWEVGRRDLSRQGLKHPSVYPTAKVPCPIHPLPEE